MARISLSSLMLWAFACATLAGDLSLELSDGRSVTLFENRTWEFKNKETPKTRSDVRLDMEDGRTLILRPNGRWLYAGERDTSSAPARPSIQQLQALGMARMQDPAAALNAARTEAVRRLSQSLRKKLNDPAITDSLAMRCIQKSIVPLVDIEKTFDESGGAHVKVTLDEDRIQDILDCLGL